MTVTTVAGPVAAGDDIWVTPCGGSYDLTPIPAGFFTSTGGASSLAYTDGISFGGVPLAISPPLVPATDVDTVVRRLSGTTALFDVGSSEVVPLQIQALHLQSCEPIVVKYDNLKTELWNVDVCLLPTQTLGTMTINHECIEGGSYSSNLPVEIQLTFTRVGGGANSPATLSPVTLMLTSSGWWVHSDPGFGLARMGPGTQFDDDCDGTVDPADPTTVNVAAADFYAGLFMDTCGGGPSPTVVPNPCCEFISAQPFCEDQTCVDCVCAQTGGTACCAGQPWDASCTAIASGPCADTGACPCGPPPPGPNVVKPKLNPEQAALAAHGVAVANASKLPGQQNPIPAEACCRPDGTCVDVDPNDCKNLYGGLPQGPGTKCATTVCVNPGPFDDHLATWIPTDLVADQTIVTFGTGLPIPPNFFGTGSDPVVGPVAFRGVPIADTLCDSSVIMRRTQNPFQPTDPPPLPPVTIPIEIVQLQLTSVDPITVTTGGANPELWNVDIDLSPAQGSLAPGSMTVQKTSANGGGFDSFFDVMPRLTFTRLSDNAVRVLDTGPGPNQQPPLQFQVSGVPWAHSTNQDIWIPPGTTFIPGIDPQTDQQVPFSPSTTNGTVRHSVCQPVPTKKVCIYDITCVQGDCSSCAAAAVGKCQGPPCPNNTCGVLAGQHSNCGADNCCIEFGSFECRKPQGEPLCPTVGTCTCDPPTPGACCRTDGTCVQTLPSQCLPPNVFHGGPCLPPQPCCLPGIGCIDLDPLCCKDQGGVVQPAGSTCSATPEACCIVDPLTGIPTCTNIDPLCCDELGGVPQGPGSLCGTDANGNMIDDACEPDPGGVCPLPFPNALCAGLQGMECIVTNPKNATCLPLSITMQDNGVGQLVPVAEKCACVPPTTLCGPIAVDAAGGLLCSGACNNVNDLCQVTVGGVQTGQSSIDAIQAQLIPQGAIVNCTCGPVTPAVCEPLADGTACAPFNCPVPPPGQECLPTCMDIIPATGEIKVTQCACGSPNECFAQRVPGAFDVQCVNACTTPGDVCTETRTVNATTGVITVCCSCGPVTAACEPLPDKSACNDFICPTGPSPAALCVVADAGGTAIMPPNCTSGYLSPTDVHEIIQGLPAGTTIEFDATHNEFLKDNNNSGPGGRFPGGEKEVFSSILNLTVTGTGALAAFNRSIIINAAVETHTAPRTAGDAVQSFDTDMFRLQGQLGADPDFCLLRITAGTDFGLPSPGHTTLTQSGGNWQVDSFFDIAYKIEFQGCPGSILEDPNTGVPYSGVTFGTVRMQAGNPAPEKCNPKQITWFPATGQILVEQCLCGTPNECHVDTTPGVVPSCVGACPNGTVCVETSTPTPDGTGFVINCSCDPLPTGACCISNTAAGAGCIDGITQPECEGTLGGLYLGDGSLCGPDVACCVPGGRCTMTSALCCTQQLGGIPHANQTCGGAPEACCLPDNTCTMADPLCCELDLGGTPEGPNSQCSATPLKCCLPDGTCDFMDPLCCRDKGGVVQTSASCNPSGGCCLPSGVCTDMDPECCIALQGVVAPALCDPATIGGCCMPDGRCQDMPRECCFLLGGNPRPTLCEPPQACCVPPTAGGPVTDGCVDTDPECCVGLGGTPLGAGSACSNLDADNNGIDDTCQCVDACADCSDADACTCDKCVGGVCATAPRKFGDSDCNGTINIFDLFCVLSGFSGDFSGDCCFTNLDVEPCAGDGDIDVFDLFAVLDAFGGSNPCNCPAGPVAAEGAQQRRTERGLRSRDARNLETASIHLIPSSTDVIPGSELKIRVYAKGVVRLRAYELKIQANGGQRGALSFTNLVVDSDRKDYVFKGIDAYSALDLVGGRIAGITFADGVSKRDSVYLGTFVFQATRDARGTFTLSVQVDRDTFLVDEVGETLKVRSAKSVEIQVR